MGVRVRVCTSFHKNTENAKSNSEIFTIGISLFLKYNGSFIYCSSCYMQILVRKESLINTTTPSNGLKYLALETSTK